MYSKTFKITARNAALGNSTSGSLLQTQGTGGPSTGVAFDVSSDGTTDSLSAATRIIKIWIPGKKFGRNVSVSVCLLLQYLLHVTREESFRFRVFITAVPITCDP
jgi:hypothetical protein